MNELLQNGLQCIGLAARESAGVEFAAMKALAIVLLSTVALAAEHQCVILKRASTGEHVWSGIEFQYVSGDYPTGFKFRENLHGRHFQKLKAMGANIQILETAYTAADLDKAKTACVAASASDEKK